MYFHFSHFQFSFLLSIHFFQDSAASSSPWCFLNVVPVVPHDFHPLRHHAFEQCFPGSDTGHTALGCVQRPQKFGWGPRRGGWFWENFLVSGNLKSWKMENNNNHNTHNNSNNSNNNNNNNNNDNTRNDWFLVQEGNGFIQIFWGDAFWDMRQLWMSGGPTGDSMDVSLTNGVVRKRRVC